MLVPLNRQEIELWRRAGRLAAEALAFGAPLIHVGTSYLSVVMAIEDFIRSRGGELAFPINISVNDTAAHDAPLPGDPRCFGSEDLVKLDVGVHINGYIGDNAVTVDLSGKHQKLCLASREALNRAVAMAVPGTRVCDLGAEIESVIRSHGFLPVKNLGGHQMGPYKLHHGIFVPNFLNKDRQYLKEGMVLAIEPFAAENCDAVKDGDACYIFNLINKVPARPNEVEPTLSSIKQQRGLPFSIRTIEKKLPLPLLSQQLESLAQQELIHYYPPLVTKTGCMVSQHEHTVIVANPPIVITREASPREA